MISLRACNLSPDVAMGILCARTTRVGSVLCLCPMCLLIWSAKAAQSRVDSPQPRRPHRDMISSLLTLRPFVKTAASLSTPSSLLAILCTSCANTPMDVSIPGSTRCTSAWGLSARTESLISCSAVRASARWVVAACSKVAWTLSATSAALRVRSTSVFDSRAACAWAEAVVLASSSSAPGREIANSPKRRSNGDSRDASPEERLREFVSALPRRGAGVIRSSAGWNRRAGDDGGATLVWRLFLSEATGVDSSALAVPIMELVAFSCALNDVTRSDTCSVRF